MIKEVDTIIVGQGIAGTCLAFDLYQQNSSFEIIDNSHRDSSSIVAAGIVNPIVFKRLTKSWNVDNLFPSMHRFYSGIERIIERQLVYPTEILQLFPTILDQNQWIEKSDAPGFEKYLGEALSKNEIETQYQIVAPFGGGVVKNSCYIDLPVFLKSSKGFFTGINSFSEHQFDCSGLIIDQNEVLYRNNDINLKAKRIVFCEGHKATENPFFKDLPFNLAKGEVIEFSHKTLMLDRIINKNGFVMPTNHNTFKLGATYEWKELNQEPTETGQKTLMEKLTFLVDKNINIESHLAGIRPTVKDRRPLIGMCKTIKNVFIFNGLGTKGALIAPYYSKQLTGLISNEIPVDDEVDIKRFSKIE